MGLWRYLFGCKHERLVFLFNSTSQNGPFDAYECEDCHDRIYKLWDRKDRECITKSGDGGGALEASAHTTK